MDKIKEFLNIVLEGKIVLKQHEKNILTVNVNKRNNEKKFKKK